jgi:cation diffusion facilitator family transporter
MRKQTAAYMAVAGGLAVFSIKLLAYFISNSVALLSDALESIVNILASIVMLFSIRVSERPADESHRYGHEKVEDISSGFEGALIIVAAIFIVIAAAGRIFAPVELVELNLAILVSVVATAMNGGISLLLSRTAKASESAALEGDAKHLLSDVISSGGIWLGLIIVQFTGWLIVDALLAFVVAAIIARMGLGLIYRSLNRLMDKSCLEEEEKIREVLDGLGPIVIEYHDLKTRRQGSKVLAEVHLTVDDNLSVREAHDVVDRLEQKLMEIAPQIVLIVHIDPLTELASDDPMSSS